MPVVLSFFFWIPSWYQAPDGEAPQGEQGQVPVRKGCQRQKYQDAQQGRQPVQLWRQRRKMEDMGKVHGPR